MDPSLIRIAITPVIALLLWVLPVKAEKKQLMGLAFFLWVAGGLSLIVAGATRLAEVIPETDTTLFALGLGAAIVVGIGKGKFVLSKTSKRNIARLEAYTEPQKLFHVYNLRSWVTIELMLVLSACLTWFAAPMFWRGVVNVAVGLALMMSSMAYLNNTNKEKTLPA